GSAGIRNRKASSRTGSRSIARTAMSSAASPGTHAVISSRPTVSTGPPGGPPPPPHPPPEPDPPPIDEAVGVQDDLGAAFHVDDELLVRPAGGHADRWLLGKRGEPRSLGAAR